MRLNRFCPVFLSRLDTAWFIFTLIGGLILSAPQGSPVHAAPPQPIQFNRDIRPVLADACFQCHGPDANRRKGDLRLDLPPRKASTGRAAREASDWEPAELLRRITSTDPDEQMPPPGVPVRLTAPQIELFRRWVDAGTPYESHWSLIPVQRPAIPTVQQPERVENPIDQFVLAALERENRSFAPQADRRTLIRRVTLDLTGLPPTVAEVEQFVSDPRPDAYERLVDRLFASPAFGERMAWKWLEEARYADTSGYQSDGERIMWRWRDWVIDAYNRNMPFDQFTIEQLAGDLLPEPTLEQRIATGFNRNHRGNAEGGIIPEEYAVEYVVDRVETTATVWLGLTLGCTRCHDHKYDPFTQREFYQLYAFFNSIPEKGRAIKLGNSPPYIAAPTPVQQAELQHRQQQVAALRQKWADAQPRLRMQLAAWEQQAGPEDRRAIAGWRYHDGEVLYHALEQSTAAPLFTPVRASQSQYATVAAVPDAAASSLKYPLPDLATCEGVVSQGLVFDGHKAIPVIPAPNFGFLDSFSTSVWVRPDAHAGGTIVSKMKDQDQADGWCLVLKDNKLQVHMTKRWLDDALRVESQSEIPAGRWSHVTMTYDGSRVASGVKLYLDGQPLPIRVLLDELNQTFTTASPLLIGGGNGEQGRLHGALDELQLFARCLSPEECRLLAATPRRSAILGSPIRGRTEDERRLIEAWFLESAANAELRQIAAELQRQERDLIDFEAALPTVMVMEELAEPRPAFVLKRGEYDKPGDRVERDTPSVLPPFPKELPLNRLGLAKWLVDPSHPLTARVTVNRFWQQFFGQGLVTTPEDFGLQGNYPSHPELLDWLSAEFMGLPSGPATASNSSSSGGPTTGPAPTAWNQKHLLWLIVTSATYRQSAQAPDSVWQADPENRRLGRGPRTRLSPEMLRDQALAVSGLLVDHMGGPSVRPYQPAGLYEELQGTEAYQPDRGAGLYRRSLYTYWKRTIAPPLMMTFDAAGRETCQVRETRTNTPLQALALWNDQIFLEAARHLADRVRSRDVAEAERINLLFQTVLARPASPAENSRLAASLNGYRKRFAEDEPSARALLTAAGAAIDNERGPQISGSLADRAAWLMLASTVLNLDEAVTRP